MKSSKSAVFPRHAQKNTFSMSVKSAKTRRFRTKRIHPKSVIPLTLFIFDLSTISYDITARSKACVICLNSRASAIPEDSVVEGYLPGSQLP